ncbi:hypothetical protein ZEAMMB73_Zm00001d033829 [Zea mays]|uniref:Uncharacterized protein n=1 Tax=Zea mays TaxID=4577 RepID=A0A1D6L2Q0_MAIZE|nr:hypothetical protein ZEAMMB73_Zm00001d033829 [Zea mays]
MKPETLALCLFQPNTDPPDTGSVLTNTIFDALRDPDEDGATVENARAFVWGLVGLDGGSWAFRPLHAGAREGYVERDHHCWRSS